jgi:hypothetical protein
MESRWLRRLRWVGPGVIALGVVGSLASVALGAGPGPWTPRPCTAGGAEPSAPARLPGAMAPSDIGRGAWFRTDPIIDNGGSLQGQRVSLGLDGLGATGTVVLPAESFAAGPFGRLVLIGSDDGTVSHLRAVDVVADCNVPLADETAVIRRATIAPAGDVIYEARVDRATRSDLGVWSRRFDGQAPARLALPPLDVDGRFGRTFSTEFTWSADGQSLAVQSCGEVACRTRILGSDGRSAGTLAEPDLGLLAGFDGNRMVTYGACRGLPCPLVATDLGTGTRQILADEAGLATVVGTSQGPRLIHEVFVDGGLRLRSIALDGGSAADVGPLPTGLRLAVTLDGSAGTARSPIDWIALVPDRDGPVEASSVQPQLRHLTDGATVQLDEVLR